MRTQKITGALSSLLVTLCAASALAVTPHAERDSRIVVTTVGGDVDVTMAGAAVEVQTDSEVILPARVITGNDGALGLTQAGTNITVSNDTDIEIPAEAVDGNLVARLVQHRGNVFYDVAPRDTGKLRVETPLLVAVIKGTQFNVSVLEDSTTISLFEGRLEIRTPDGSEVIELNAGEIAIRSRLDEAIRVVGMNDDRVAAARPAARPALDARPPVDSLTVNVGGGLRTPPQWLVTVALAIATLACAYWFARRGWRVNLAAVVAACVALAAASLTLYAAARVLLEVAPFALVLSAMFVAATIRSLDEQTWRALAGALGVKRRDALLKSVVDSSSDGIVCIDEHGAIRTANPATASLFGCPHATLFHAKLTDFIPGLASDVALGLASLTGTPLERTAQTADGRRVPVELTLSRVATEEGLFTAILRDVSERQAQQRALEHQATHDPLTALPNRTALARYLGALLAQASGHQRVALLMLDLTRFKEVNDTLGHDIGDEVLREVARRFSSQSSSGAFIGRIGGDEFAVVLPEVTDHSAIDALAQRFIESLRSPIDSRGIAIEVGVNIGIAVAPDHGLDRARATAPRGRRDVRREAARRGLRVSTTSSTTITPCAGSAC